MSSIGKSCFFKGNKFVIIAICVQFVFIAACIYISSFSIYFLISLIIRLSEMCDDWIFINHHISYVNYILLLWFIRRTAWEKILFKKSLQWHRFRVVNIVTSYESNCYLLKLRWYARNWNAMWNTRWYWYE